MPKVKIGSGTGYSKRTVEWRGTIKGAMAEREVNQTDLGKKMSLSPSSISRKLKNIDNLTLGELRIIADVVGLEIQIKRKG